MQKKKIFLCPIFLLFTVELPLGAYSRTLRHLETSLTGLDESAKLTNMLPAAELLASWLVDSCRLRAPVVFLELDLTVTASSEASFGIPTVLLMGFLIGS